MPPTVLFVPGFWVGTSPFTQVTSLLQSQGVSTQIVALPSTGSTSPGNPTMLDDIAAIRSAAKKLVEAEKGVVLVLHSGGGFLGSNAIEGLTVKARSNKGLKGGIIQIVFLSGAVFPEGFKHGPLPFAVVEGGAMHCQAPEKLLYGDLPDEASAKAWTATLRSQPATGWDDTITYCGWREVPSVYLVCEGDQCLPISLQLQLAELAGSRIERCTGGHMAVVSQFKKVAEVIGRAIEFSEVRIILT